MELALEVGEEAGQNSPTDTCLVLSDSVPSVQVTQPQQERHDW